jgi:hypothetical protein
VQAFRLYLGPVKLDGNELVPRSRATGRVCNGNKQITVRR